MSPTYQLHAISYAWLQIGGICVYVADVDDADEQAIKRQIDAIGIGLA